MLGCKILLKVKFDLRLFFFFSSVQCTLSDVPPVSIDFIIPFSCVFFTCLIVSFKSAQGSMYIFALPSFSKCGSSLCSSQECFWNGQRHFWRASLESSHSTIVPGICQCYTCQYHSSPQWMQGWKSKKFLYFMCFVKIIYFLSIFSKKQLPVHNI